MISKEIQFCRKCLENQYRTSPIEREVCLRQETNGGRNFASAIQTSLNQTNTPKAIQAIINALDSIVSWPNAGWLSWEMRRFIRRVSCPEEIIEFGNLITKVGTKLPYGEKTIGYTFLGMDDLFWGGETIRDVLDKLSKYAHGENAYLLCDHRHGKPKLCLDLPELQTKCKFAPHALNFCSISV